MGSSLDCGGEEIPHQIEKKKRRKLGGKESLILEYEKVVEEGVSEPDHSGVPGGYSWQSVQHHYT